MSSSTRSPGRAAAPRGDCSPSWPTAASTSPASGATTCSATCRRPARCASGPVDDGEQRFVLLDEWIPAPRRLEREEALAELALRFFRGHGPATVKDLARWAGLPHDRGPGRPRRRAGRPRAARGRRRRVLPRPGDRPTCSPACRAEACGAFLLPGFDEFVLGYGDRSGGGRPGVRRADRAGRQRHVPADRRPRGPDRRHLGLHRPGRRSGWSPPSRSPRSHAVSNARSRGSPRHCPSPRTAARSSPSPPRFHQEDRDLPVGLLLVVGVVGKTATARSHHTALSSPVSSRATPSHGSGPSCTVTWSGAARRLATQAGSVGAPP